MTVIYSNYAAELINSGNSVVVGRVGAAILPGCKPLLGGGIVGISRYSQKQEACKQFFHWYYSADVAPCWFVWVAPPPLWMPMRISRTTASSRG